MVVLDLRKIADIFEYFLILSASNTRHLKIVTDYIVEELKKKKIKLISKEGSAQSGWILLDYGDIIVHGFLEETRSFYDLERLFKDA
ncbi:hypothetical protein LCGC14_3135580, partial [marine sediment metagenome]